MPSLAKLALHSRSRCRSISKSAAFLERKLQGHTPLKLHFNDMASTEVTTTIISLENASSNNKIAGYGELLLRIVNDSSASEIEGNLTAYVNSILGNAVGMVAARPLLATFVDTLKSLPTKYLEAKTNVGQHALELIEPRVVSFEVQDADLRFVLADAYEEQEEYSLAAKILQGIQLESSQRQMSDDDKVNLWLRITRNYLEEDDTTSAEMFLNRAKSLLYRCQDPAAKAIFQLSQARILDARREFLQASSVYHQFSHNVLVEEEERIRGLSSSIICAVLAPAGPQRSRALARIYRDERSTSLDEFSILEKMFLDRLLSPDEVGAFQQKLSQHHLAKASDGLTPLDKAVIEHNVLAASHLYDNIRTADLGTLLNVDGERAREYAARMIEQGRLAGKIDQIDQVIFFDGSEASGESTKAGQADGVVGKLLRRWDGNVQGLAEEVERVTSMLQTQYPDFVAANMAHL